MKRYRVTIDVCLSGDVLSWFEDCRVQSRPGGTELLLDIVDQAALYGVLHRIEDLGLPLREAVLDESDEP